MSSSMAEATRKYTVVTGANKWIGLETCRQLASKGIVVVLTARDEKRGLEAAQKLTDSGLSDYVVSHQLDVADDVSVNSLADFIKTQFGKLDILNAPMFRTSQNQDIFFLVISMKQVNHAGISGVKTNVDALRASSMGKEGVEVNYKEFLTESSELAEECLNINYYGPKRMAEALNPLLQVSDSPMDSQCCLLQGEAGGSFF